MKIAPHLEWRHNPHLKGSLEFHLRTDVSICRQCLSRNPPSGIQLQISFYSPLLKLKLTFKSRPLAVDVADKGFVH